MKVTKKFWVYIIGGICICFLLVVVINNKLTERERIKRIIACCQNNNAIKEKEITYRFYSTPISLTLEAKNKLESQLKHELWKEYFLVSFQIRLWNYLGHFEDVARYWLLSFDVIPFILSLKNLVFSLVEPLGLNFYVEGEYVIPFLKNTKIYEVRIRKEGKRDFIRRFIVGVQNGDKIFNLNNLKEINNLIKGEKIWLDTSSKVINYATLLTELTATTKVEIINLISIKEFIEKFIVGPDGVFGEVEGGEWEYYGTVQEYAWFFPKKYQELLNYQNNIEEGPQLIKETKYNYEIILWACEKLTCKEKKSIRGEYTLTELKLTVYKNGEINLKRKYLVRKIKKGK